VRLGSAGRRLAAALLPLLSLAVAYIVLQRPTPLFANLGAGDEELVRGFREDWERDGLHQTGETMFRWTEDGARLELPVSAALGEIRVRLRLARFADSPADVRIVAGGRVVDAWHQPPRGWRVRTFSLPHHGGPLALQFRSDSPDGQAMGVALDWVELQGVRGLRPAARLLPGILALLVAVPALLGLLGSLRAGWLAACLLPLFAGMAVHLDRFGGMVAVSHAGIPAVVTVLGLFLAAAGQRRVAPGWLPAGPGALALPVAGAVIALVALLHPFFYYPDVDTHADFVAALKRDTGQALDPTPYQERTGAWTRTVGGRRVLFPYSPVFHLLALPLSLLLGEATAVKTVAITAVGATALLVHALARGIGQSNSWAVVAQALFLSLPVVSSRLSLALFPALLAQALESLLLVFFLRHLEAPRRPSVALWTGALLLAVQAAYTGSILNVGLLLALLALLDALGGQPRRALLLVGLNALAVTLVVALLYARFLPTLWRAVLPAATAPDAATAASPIRAAGHRLWLFYGPLYPALVALGLLATRRLEPLRRRVIAAALAAGLGLLALRFAVPALFRDVKEVELLAATVAALSAAGLAWVARAGRIGRLVSVGLVGTATVWGLLRAAVTYGERFLAVGR
jgi:hypothetical protein